MVSYQLAVLVLLKGLASPVVLYSEHPKMLYETLKQAWQKASLQHPKLIEQETSGPLKRVCFYDTDIVGLALQGDTLTPESKPVPPQTYTPAMPSPQLKAQARFS